MKTDQETLLHREPKRWGTLRFRAGLSRVVGADSTMTRSCFSETPAAESSSPGLPRRSKGVHLPARPAEKMRTPKGRWAHGLGRREADGSDAGLTRSRARGPVQGTDRGWGQRGPNHTHSHPNMAVTYPNDVRQDKGAAEGRWVPSRRVPSPAPCHVAHGAEPRPRPRPSRCPSCL